MPGAGRLGVLLLLVAVALLGLPPLAGFIGKLLILRGAEGMPWIWGVVLVASLLQLVAVARAGVRLFWAVTDEPPAANAVALWRLAPVIGLLIGVALLSVFAAPAERYARLAAEQVLAPADYIGAVLGRDALMPSVLQAGVGIRP